MIEIVKYPDSSSYARIDSNLRDEIIFRINSYEDLWHLNQYVDAFYSQYADIFYSQFDNTSVPNIIIPCLLDAQADRRFNKGESFGLKLVCEFLNRMNANFKIFHPHNPEVVEALMDNVEIIDNSEFIKKVLYKLSEVGVSSIEFGNDLSNNLILMSSDAGGFKPLMKLCDKINWQGETYSASKSRKYENEESIITQIVDREGFQGKDILIIDDICVYGGTFKGLSKLLRERNCGKLYLAVSHMTVNNLGKDPVTNYFDKVFTTNSKFDYYKFENHEGMYDEDPENLQIIKQF
jgi:ribose-phosphate pyrophosphokinase